MPEKIEIITQSSLPPDDLKLLEASSFWRNLGTPQRHTLLAHARIDTYAAGKQLFAEGEVPAFGYISLSGRVALQFRRSDGTEGMIEVLTPGQLIPATSIILNQPYIATGRCLDTSRILRFPTPVLQDLLAHDVVLCRATLQQVAGLTRLLINQLRCVKLLTANERLAHYLLALTPIQSGRAEVLLEEERRLIAQRLAMKPESLSRAIAALRPVGVQFDNRHVTIMSVEELRQYCGLQFIP